MNTGGLRGWFVEQIEATTTGEEEISPPEILFGLGQGDVAEKTN